jgi:hypothetical protein
MRILGVDFTSRPRAGKPLTCAEALLRNGVVSVSRVRRLADFPAFETLLREPGPWVGGFDFPFGLPRALLDQLGWPAQWSDYVGRVESMSREAFRELLDAVRVARPAGAKYLHRATDIPAGSSSPMKLVNPPVALMFYEGAPRLLASGVSVPPCAGGDPQRVALEAYPGALARQFTRQSYKADERRKQTAARRAARRRILDGVADPESRLGFAVDIAPALAEDCLDDGSGDTLDAVLCALQAAWACSQRSGRFGIPDDADASEGWIIGPIAAADTVMRRLATSAEQQ